MSVSLNKIISNYLNNNKIMNGPNRNSHYLTTGFPKLDELIGGYTKGEHIIITGHTGIGLTSFILSSIYNLSLVKKFKTLFITPDQSSKEILYRLIAIKLNTSPGQITRNRISMEAISKTCKEFTASGLDIADNIQPSLQSIKESITGQKARYDYVFIDSLAFIHADQPDRQSNTNEAIRQLQSILHLVPCPIISASAINQNQYNHSKHQFPTLKDFRYRGTEEERASKILLIFHPEYYKIDVDEDDNPTQGLAMVSVLKNDTGKTGSIEMTYNGKNGLYT